MTLAPGTRLGTYELLSPLGAGGMGVVWRARDTALGREVAVKLLPDEWSWDPDRVERFEREAGSCSRRWPLLPYAGSRSPCRTRQRSGSSR